MSTRPNEVAPQGAAQRTGALEELLAEASSYGKVAMRQVRHPCWYADIEFHTVDQVKLEAKSGYDHPTPHEALRAAIDAAEQIRSQFK